MVELARTEIDGDLVELARPVGADLVLEHVAQHPLGVALLGRPVPAAAAGADADHVTGDEVERRLRRQPRLDAVADVHVLGDPPGVAAERAPRSRLVAVGEHGEGGVEVEEIVLAQPEAAPEAARPFGVLHEREPVDADRVVELGLLDRRVLGVLAVRLDGIGTVARIPAAVATRERVVEAGVLPGGDVEGAEACLAHHPLRPRRQPLGAGRQQRADDHLDQPRVGLPAAHDRAGPGAVRDAPGRRVQADEPVEAVVDGQIRVDQALEGVRAGRERHRVGRVDRGAPLRVGAGRVEASALLVDLDPHLQPDGLVGVAVRVDEALGLVDAVRERGELGPGAPLRVLEQLLHRREDRVAPVAVDQRRDASHAGGVRGDLGAEVARRLVLRADLGQDQREDVLHDRAAVDQLDRRDDHALLEDLLERPDRGRRAAADVDVVREVRDVADQLALVVDG